MTAAINQNFNTYAGDAALPIFTVVDGSNRPIDIETVGSITWSAFRAVNAAPVLTKTYTLAPFNNTQIKFVTNGTDGKFQVLLTGADTAPLSGLYLHQAVIIDGLGNQSTVSLGQFTVGRAPVWSYDATQLTTSTLYQIRALIQDTQIGQQQIYDDEINFVITLLPGQLYRQAADCCRMIASKYAREVDTVQADLRIAYSTRQRNYQARADELDKLANIRGGGLPYAGGISQMDKLSQILNDDRVQPQFNIGMQDSYLPQAPVGNVLPIGIPGVDGAAQMDVGIQP